MPNWIEAVLGGTLGVVIIGAVFWMTFIRIPDQRRHGAISDSNADCLLSGNGNIHTLPSQHADHGGFGGHI